MTRLGYQIPNFTYEGVAPAELFPTVAAQAREAEASGFDTVLVMDHFYQLFSMGPPEHEMLECYTLLAALAQHTSKVRLSALVTGNTYRAPALLAKAVTTLDHVSGGRAQLGIGAGWFELEHDSLGFEFGTFTERFERLEESLQIVRGMLAGTKPSLEGKWYTVKDAVNSPAPLSRIPIMIGGAGEKKTLRMAAQYADESNLICGANEVPHKLEVLAGHCEALGRDRSELTVTLQTSACIGSTHDEAVATFDAYVAGLRAVCGWDDATTAFVTGRVIVGDPDEVAAAFSERLVDGLDGFTVNMPSCGHLEGRVELLGQALSQVV